MKRMRVIAVSALAAGVGSSAAIGHAGATGPSAASPAIGMEVLDMLCVEQDGQAFTTPFTISRCQEARTRPGFEIEALVCEGLLGGTFLSAPSTGKPWRTTWICRPGSV